MGQFEVVNGADVGSLPVATWQIPDLLPSASLALLYSPPGVGKSFLCLDLCLSIATGLPWLGRPTVAGDTVLVVGEGAGDVALRVSSWLAHRGLIESDLERFHVVLGAVDLATGESDLLADQLGVMPSLYVFDTLARCSSASENSVSGMGEVIAACARLQARGASVILSHHSSKVDAEIERGSSALRGACDVVYRLERGITLSCEKMKYGAEPDDISLTLRAVGGSAVIDLAPTPDLTLDAFYGLLALDDSRTLAQWRREYSTRNAGADFATVARDLIASGWAERWNGLYLRSPKAVEYFRSLAPVR